MSGKENMRTAPEKETQKKIYVLDLFRAAGCVLIFGFHCDWLAGNRFYDLVFARGYNMVTFFFVLSGFATYLRYRGTFSSLKRDELAAFYKKKLLRIYPLYFVSLLLSIPVSYCFFQLPGVQDRARYLFLNLFALQSWSRELDVWFAFNDVAWTISTELLGYGIAPFAIYLLNRQNSKMNIVKMGGALFGLYLVFCFGISQNSLSRWLTSVFPLVRVWDFIIGLLAGRLYALVKESKKTLRSASCLEILALLLTGAVLFVPQLNQKMIFQMEYIPFFVFLIFVFNFEEGICSRGILKLQISASKTFLFYMFHKIVMRYAHTTVLWKVFGDIGYALVLGGLTYIAVTIIHFAVNFMGKGKREERAVSG